MASGLGDRVRVVVGSFEGVASPLIPAEPFTFLDVQLRRTISIDLPAAYNALVDVLKGSVLVRAADREQKVAGKHYWRCTATADASSSRPSNPRIFSSCRVPRSTSRCWWMGPTS